MLNKFSRNLRRFFQKIGWVVGGSSHLPINYILLFTVDYCDLRHHISTSI